MYIALAKESTTCCTNECMGAMGVDLSRSGLWVLLPSFVVDTNESLRQRALRLITHGVSQKVLAGKMGMKPSTFSRWLNQKAGINPASVTALDGFNAYVHELNVALSEDVIRQPSVSESLARESGRTESAGPATKRDGRAIATSVAGAGQSDPVSDAARPGDRSLRARLEHKVAALEGRPVGPPARASARAARQPAPGAHHKTAGAGVRDRKPRR